MLASYKSPGLRIQMHEGEASTEPTVTVSGFGGFGAGRQVAVRMKLTILEHNEVSLNYVQQDIPTTPPSLDFFFFFLKFVNYVT